MNILYLGSFFEKSRAHEIWSDSIGTMVIAGDVFQQALLDGWRINRVKNITILTAPAIGSYPVRYRKLWFRESIFNFYSNRNVCVGFLNLTYVKQYSMYFSIKKNIRQWAQSKPGAKSIIVYGLLEPYLKAAISIKREYPEIKISCIVLDLPKYFDDKNDFISTIFSKLVQKKITILQSSIDSYILLTKHMPTPLHLGCKPFMLLEGIYSNSDAPTSQVAKIENEKVILYTGKLDNRFGLSELLEAFMGIPDSDYKLWICGDGSAKTNVVECSKKDSRIKYLGLLNREDILILQKQATLLINPRKGNDEYTKYSFPSKTMEYMASGTPTVMYPLPGVPDEYYNFLVIVSDDSLITLQNKIIEWCEKPQDELDEFGEKAKNFILNNKCAEIQSKRLLEFVLKNY
jgi:glycosyltransferase involved in cell wall biosynthesis